MVKPKDQHLTREVGSPPMGIVDETKSGGIKLAGGLVHTSSRQLRERSPEKREVGGSIPSPGATLNQASSADRALVSEKEDEGREAADRIDGVFENSKSLGSMPRLSKTPTNTLGVSGSNPLPGTNLAHLPPKEFTGQAKAFWVEWKKPLGLTHCPYAYRWVLGLPWFSIRIHHWISSDDARNFHDHPWWFITFVLWGGYTDVSPAGRARMNQFSCAYRPALHRHTVVVDPAGCWTILLCGPEIRDWGFWVKDKFKKMNKYFLEHGHHPCVGQTKGISECDLK